MPTTYTAGYGGTLTIATVTIPVQNVTVDLSRQEIDITDTRDLTTYAMAGRLTRKITCTAFATTVAETALTNLIATTTDTKAAVTWNDGNSGTSYSITCMLNSASRSYDGQGAATINFNFTEARV